MIRRLFLILFYLHFQVFVFGQALNKQEIMQLFQDRKYSAVQSICQKIINNGEANEFVDYYNARCSKELFLEDAYHLYADYLDKYSYSKFIPQAHQDIALLHFRDQDYEKAIAFFLSIEEIDQKNDLLFKLAYANFRINAFSEATYYFSKLIERNSKYTAASRYYYAYIAYENELYKTALNEFSKLLDDKKFKHIVPYYITHIYFAQKRYGELIDFTKPILDNIKGSRIEEMHRLLAESYYALDDYKNAVRYFNNYLSVIEEPSSIICFLLGHSYFRIENYDKAILFLERVVNSPDSVMQNSTYYLASSYLKNENYYYALQAFKKASTYNYDLIIKEEAYFNYAKLSYQLELPFDNTLNILRTYLEDFDNPLHRKHIETLMAKTLKGTSRYGEALSSLENIYLPNLDQQASIQQLSYFLGVQAYNSLDYKLALSYFSQSNQYKINADFSFLSHFWLADCYYQLSNYNKAAEIYSKLPVSNNINLEHYEVLQKYNIAYCYFHQQEFELSNKYFRLYEKLAKDSMKLNDTYLRIADCFFMTNNYLLAEKYYNKAIQYDLFDSDYAMYNRSTCLALLGDYNSQLELLKTFQSRYPNSVYFDDALYVLASYYQNIEDYTESLNYYDALLASSQDENLIAETRLSKGMIFFNNNNIEEAIDQFLFVINNYQKTKYFREGLAGLQSAYTTLGEIDKYLNIIEELPEMTLSAFEQDSLIYSAAFLKFSEANYELANTTFDKYISKFGGEGVFIDDAKYYNALCLINLKDTTSAITLYKDIVKSNASNNYKEPALVFLARRYYFLNNFTLSNQYYQELELIASNNTLSREAIINLMYGNEFLDSNLALKYANKVIALDKKDNKLLSKASLIVARDEFKSGNYAKSRKTFAEVHQLSKYDEGAEAAYYLTYLTYLDDSLNLAEAMIFKLAEDYTNDYFIAKSFLLLADIYIDQGNRFQAKAALESIISNYKGDQELVNIARKKWEFILESESIPPKIKAPSSYINIFEEDIDYEFDSISSSMNIIDEYYEVEMPDSLKIQTDSIKNETE